MTHDNTTSDTLTSWRTAYSTALFATLLALVLTRLTLGISSIEANPITAALIEQVEFDVVAVIGLIVTALSALTLQHIQHSTTNHTIQRTAVSGTWTIAGISIVDVDRCRVRDCWQRRNRYCGYL